MAICEQCEQEMADDSTNTCISSDFEYPDGSTLAAIPYPEDASSRCHDCNVAPGGFHHLGCDMERCPKCGGQLIGCGCSTEESAQELLTREEIAEALDLLWERYQPDDQPDRPLKSIFKDISRDASRDAVLLGIMKSMLTAILRKVRRNEATELELKQFCEDMWAVSTKKELKECELDSSHAASRS